MRNWLTRQAFHFSPSRLRGGRFTIGWPRPGRTLFQAVRRWMERDKAGESRRSSGCSTTSANIPRSSARYLESCSRKPRHARVSPRKPNPLLIPTLSNWRLAIGPGDLRAPVLLRAGKIWERSPVAQSPVNSHRINGTDILVRSHNPKVVGSNPTPATMGAERSNLEAPFFVLVAGVTAFASEFS